MLKTIISNIKEYKSSALKAPLFMVGEVLIECLIPLVMAGLIDHMEDNNLKIILDYGLILIVLSTLSLICGKKSGEAAASASSGLAKNLRKSLFYQIQDFAFADIDKFSTSSLVTRMTTDVSNVQNAFGMIIRMAVRAPLMCIISVIMSFRISAKMSLIFLALIPVLAIALFAIAIKVGPIFKRIFKRYDAMNNTVQENVSGVRVVKSFVREDYEIEKFKKASEEVRNDFSNVEKILALNTPIMTFCIYIAILLVSYLGALTIINSSGSSLTTGELSSLINYGVQILSSLMMLSFIFVMLSMSVESAQRISEVLNYESTLTSPENGLQEMKDASIDFEKVSFRYKEEASKNALNNINLHIPSGSTVGIIGATGSSKTTLIQLIPRLYDVSSGELKVGGVNVKDYDLDYLREQVAIVLQKNILFSGTINENLRWGNKEASQEEIIEACQIAQASEFIEQFPDKYETQISQGGTNVSGGQKQRLCIARALLRKPKILIFDDSTSAVDTKTDALIRQGLATKIPDTTKIIIAQRLASVQDADLIIVLNEGEIVEQGNHESLLAENGIYKEIYDSQNKMQEEKSNEA